MNDFPAKSPAAAAVVLPPTARGVGPQANNSKKLNVSYAALTINELNEFRFHYIRSGGRIRRLFDLPPGLQQPNLGINAWTYATVPVAIELPDGKYQLSVELEQDSEAV